MKEESMIKGSVDPVNMACKEKILQQMKNCVCKVKIDNINATGFFCKIPIINRVFFMTNHHVINEDYTKEKKEIHVLLNDEKEAKRIDLTIKREKYFNDIFDITLIELKDNDNVEQYIELDDNIFKNDEQIYYEKKSIYILHYLLGNDICVSYGILNGLSQYDIIHACSTDNGSSGSPILNLKNNKVIGIHKQGSNYSNFNKGTLLKYPLNDFIKKYNKNNKNEIIINTKNNQNNIITDKINIKKDINKRIQIINSFENVKRNYPYIKVDDENKYKNEKEIKVNNLLRQNKDKEESIKKIIIGKEKEIKLLKEKIKLKDEIIINLNEKIKTLSKKQIIEHKTIVDDEEFNSLVDENVELTNINNELVEKLNFLIKQRKEINYYQNENVINKQKEEIINLNKKCNQLFNELNQFKDKNYELNRQIGKLRSELK